MIKKTCWLMLIVLGFDSFQLAHAMRYIAIGCPKDSTTGIRMQGAWCNPPLASSSSGGPPTFSPNGLTSGGDMSSSAGSFNYMLATSRVGTGGQSGAAQSKTFQQIHRAKQAMMAMSQHAFIGQQYEVVIDRSKMTMKNIKYLKGKIKASNNRDEIRNYIKEVNEEVEKLRVVLNGEIVRFSSDYFVDMYKKNSHFKELVDKLMYEIHMSEYFSDDLIRQTTEVVLEKNWRFKLEDEDNKIRAEKEVIAKKVQEIVDHSTTIKNPCQGCYDKNCSYDFAQKSIKEITDQLRRLDPEVDQPFVDKRSVTGQVGWNIQMNNQNHNTLPNPKTPARVDTYSLNSIQNRELWKRYHHIVYFEKPNTEMKREAKEMSLESLEFADEALRSGNQELSETYKEISKEIIDSVFGWDPITGMGRSIYELISGKNVVTGELLSDFDRSFAFVNILTIGNFKSVGTLSKALIKLGRRAPGIETLIQSGQDFYKWTKKILPEEGHTRWFRDLQVKPASIMNEYLSDNFGVKHPPFKPGTQTSTFFTTKQTDFIRVHGSENSQGHWMIKKGSIEGLTPDQIRTKLNLPRTPTHVTEIRVFQDAEMTRGMTNFNNWSILDKKYGPIEKMEGQVQYFLHNTQRYYTLGTKPLK